VRHPPLLPARHGRPTTGAGPPPSAAAPPAPAVDPRAAVRGVARAGTVLAAGALALFAVVATAVLASGGHDRVDLVVRRDLLHHDLLGDGGPATGLAHLAGGLASPVLVAVGTVAAVVALWRGARRPMLGAGLLAVAVSTTALVQLLALALSGVRPSTTVLLGLPVFDGSFPSVRTAAAIALWGGLAVTGVLLVRRRAGRVLCVVSGLLLSGLVAWGQLDRAHAWPTDVLAGWLLGAAAVGVAAALLATWPVLPDPVLPADADTPGGRASGDGGTTLGR